MTRIFEIDDEARAIEYINRAYCNNSWSYGSRSNTDKNYDQGHWKVSLGLDSIQPLAYDHSKMPFIKKHPAVETMWSQLKDILKDDSILVRAYINGYTYGTDGYAHLDDPWINEQYGKDTLSETCIFYLNEEWHHDWGGETVVFNDDLEIESAVLPKPNRLFIFDSNKLHAARPLSRICNTIRKVLVMKTASKVVNEPKVDYIRNTYSEDNAFARFYNIAKTVHYNELADNIVQAAMFIDIFKDTDATRSEIQELLGLYPYEVVELYHELHHNKDNIIQELENSEDITPVMKRDLGLIHYAALYEDRGSVEDMDRLIQVVQSNERKDTE